MFEQDYEIKVTKKQKLLEVNNDMAHNFYYLIHVRIYNKEKTRYRKAKFVVWFDAFDVQEYYEKDWYDNNDIEDYVGVSIYCFTDMIGSYNDTKYFYEMCNDSIVNYNKIAKYWQ